MNMKRTAMGLIAVVLLGGTGAVVCADTEEPSGYLALGMFNPAQGHYDDGWEIAGIGVPDRDRKAGMRLGIGLSLFDTRSYHFMEGEVPPGDQEQLWLDAGYVVQFGGEEQKRAYFGGGLTFITATWDGPQGDVDDEATGWHLVLGSRVSERFLLEAEWVGAQFGRFFMHEKAGGLTIRAGWGF